MTRLSLDVPDELDHLLAVSAKKLDIPREDIICEAIRSYLQEIQEDTEDYNDVLEELEDDSPKISWENVQKANNLI